MRHQVYGVAVGISEKSGHAAITANKRLPLERKTLAASLLGDFRYISASEVEQIFGDKPLIQPEAAIAIFQQEDAKAFAAAHSAEAELRIEARRGLQVRND